MVNPGSGNRENMGRDVKKLIEKHTYKKWATKKKSMCCFETKL